MGGTKKLTGRMERARARAGLHTIMALIELESALTLHSCISVTDSLKINGPKTQ